MVRRKIDTGDAGELFTAGHLRDRKYSVTLMPRNNKRYDLNCVSPVGSVFMVEVKTSSSKDTQVPFQIRLLNGPLDPDLYFVCTKLVANTDSEFEYYVMTHSDLKMAWDQMPKINVRTNAPYVMTSTGWIKWEYILSHRESMGKTSTVSPFDYHDASSQI
jgi:hypothetical protein